MSTSFIILRRETAGGYSSRGPIAQPMAFKEARDEIVRLKKLFPHQDFVIMGEVGEATKSERVTVKIDAPDLSDATPKKRGPRKVAQAQPAPQEQPAPQAPDSWNVVPLRKEETG
jgi:hypothetical protein